MHRRECPLSKVCASLEYHRLGTDRRMHTWERTNLPHRVIRHAPPLAPQCAMPDLTNSYRPVSFRALVLVGLNLQGKSLDAEHNTGLGDYSYRKWHSWASLPLPFVQTLGQIFRGTNLRPSFRQAQPRKPNTPY